MVSQSITVSSRLNSRRGGFTLIELSVVLFASAVLATVLFAVVTRAREAGRRATCVSNLMQIGIGLRQYVEDHDGFMPIRYLVIHPGHSNPPGNAFGHQKPNNWRVQLFPYVKNANVFICPSNPNNKTSATIHPKNKHWVIPGQTVDINVSYGCNYNSSGSGVFGDVDAMQTIHRREIPYPIQTIAVVESLATDPELDIDEPDMIGELFAGHRGFSHYLFVDGHVKGLRPLDTYYDGSTIRNMWYRDHKPFVS